MGIYSAIHLISIGYLPDTGNCTSIAGQKRFLIGNISVGTVIINIFAPERANNMWKDILYVGIGGGIGSIFRFLASRFVIRYVSAEWLFAGTLAVNMTGCFLIGILSGWMLAHQPENQTFRLLFIIGFCGVYTTFSTFAFENLRLIEMNQWGLFGLYTFTSVVLGLLAVWGGMKLAN